MRNNTFKTGSLTHCLWRLDSLSVPAQTEAVRAEREFIEATSRICSFNVQSRPGVPITPIEIRLIKDRLSLVARVLSESEDAYKYPDIILELVRKLGFKKSDIVAEVKVRAMLADAALQSEDFERAAEMAEKMVSLLGKVKALPTDVSMNEAIEVCWHSCFQLGRQPEFQDTKRKLSLLGHSLQLCPPENMLDILAVWRRLESEYIEANKMNRRGVRSERGSRKSLSLASEGAGSSFSGRSGTLFSGHLSDYAPSSARQALSKGMGWLIGDDG